MDVVGIGTPYYDMAVSYTHLAYGLARSSGRLAESIRNINMGIMMIPSVALLVGTYGPVSYTHLDVYKRQVPH